MQRGVLGSTPRPHSLDVSSIPTPSCNNKKCLTIFTAKYPLSKWPYRDRS